MTAADPERIDAAVIGRLYEEHAGELRRFLVGLLRNDDLAGEALQNAFTKAVERGHTAQAESRKSWLFQVAYREAMLLRRRGKIHEKSLRNIAREDSSRTSEPPVERLLRSESVDRLRAALDELPPEQRQVVRMRIYDGKTFAVIAAELDVPLGTVLTRMRRAQQRLSRRLNDTNK